PHPDANWSAETRVAQLPVFVGHAALNHAAVHIGHNDAAAAVLLVWASDARVVVGVAEAHIGVFVSVSARVAGEPAAHINAGQRVVVGLCIHDANTTKTTLAAIALHHNPVLAEPAHLHALDVDQRQLDIAGQIIFEDDPAGPIRVPAAADDREIM